MKAVRLLVWLVFIVGGAFLLRKLFETLHIAHAGGDGKEKKTAGGGTTKTAGGGTTKTAGAEALPAGATGPKSYDGDYYDVYPAVNANGNPGYAVWDPNKKDWLRGGDYNMAFVYAYESDANKVADGQDALATAKGEGYGKTASLGDTIKRAAEDVIGLV